MLPRCHVEEASGNSKKGYCQSMPPVWELVANPSHNIAKVGLQGATLGSHQQNQRHSIVRVRLLIGSQKGALEKGALAHLF